MTTAAFTTLYDEVLPDVPGVPQNVALNAIRNACIEFCERTCCWVVDATPMNSVGAQAAYSFVPPTDTEVAQIIQAWHNGNEIYWRTAAQLNAELSEYGSDTGTPWVDQTGIPQYFTIERPDQFILVPFPETGVTNGIEMKYALKPTRTAAGMEAWIVSKYREELASGAKYKLFSMMKKPWSDVQLAAYHKSVFDLAICGAAAQSSHTKPPMYTSISPI